MKILINIKSVWPIGLLLGLILLLLAGVYACIDYSLLAPIRKQSAELQQLQLRSAHYLADLQQLPQLQQQLRQGQQHLNHDHDFLNGHDPSVASAQLMQHVMDIISHLGADTDCEITQKMPVPASDSIIGTFQRVQISLSLHCDPRHLTSFLYGVEYGHPYAYISEFSLYPAQDGHGDVGSGSLELQLTVASFIKSDPSVVPSTPESER